MPTVPENIPTTIAVAVAALAAGCACVAAAGRLTGKAKHGTAIERTAVIVTTLLCVAVLVYRALVVHKYWAPLQSHVDGLLLLTGLLGVLIIYVQSTGRLRGLDVFALPVLTVMLAWGICASWWSFRPFAISTVWQVVHLIGVYTALLAVVTAGTASVMYLFVRRQLKRHDQPARSMRLLGGLASLESIERTIVTAATAGFVLLSVAIITGLVIDVEQSTTSDSGWWYSKVILAAMVWVIYALVTHVRLAPALRGRRAAVLALVGFALLLIVLLIAMMLPGCASWEGGVRVSSDPDEPMAAGAPADESDWWAVEARR